MFSKFLSIDIEKQNRILNAAMKEFAKKGYEKASTNEIVKESEISKGLLFHYFKNKKQLFLYLYDYCVGLNMNEFYKKINLNESDFFIRLRQTQLIKMELLKKYPEIFRFIETSYLEDSNEIKQELEAKNKELMNKGVDVLFKGIDMSKFKDGIDIKKVINIVVWTLQGFADEVMTRKKLSSSNPINYDNAFLEADEYLNMLKNCFYK
ncbi:TetR family transcriptional regulator [Clostridium carboxidivorans P7]|uniref:Transcriptional regulator, TetR family n=1 Tax=Clostridium carboxidivorans P7 TaxID=536227 RepID=C6PYR8_9CLOT|nr:TetR/AcrR family transcriptional regulator [Clostridium carboxidivorans]AKN29993.1 TetR family transcriptional regulator [Clostridium carboxidivorans P7]EET85599.1 transcriptional regulator, TetR family [Clostridium carboxidivorans P7]